MLKKEFLEAKERAIISLEKACIENKVDTEILSILSLINNSEKCYTSSSCSGRIILLELPKIGDKKRAKFLGKWHRTVKSSEVKTAAKNAKNGFLLLIAQSPIIHIITESSEMADKIIKTAISSGFKNSGLKAITGKIVVEICSTERLDSPIGKDGILFCKEEHLKLLVDISNQIIEKSMDKLLRFENRLKEYFR
jgi:tRNA wybutosine-synthesizing protein 3